MFDDIVSFSGEHRWLSNFAPVEIVFDWIRFPSVEHAYQAAKLAPHNIVGRTEIANARTPGAAKRLGQKIQLQPWWTAEYRISIMRKLQWLKYEPFQHGFGVINPYFIRLIETGDRHIEEGNTWGDTFWGTVDRKGSNHLGKLIMEIRADCLKLYKENPETFTKKQ